MKKVLIIGAGPAGFFAAFKLAESFDVTIIDKGRDIEQRTCYIPEKGKCIRCKPCNIIYGGGGAGLCSDGKLIFSTEIGSNINEIAGQKKNTELVNEVEKIFSTYNVNVIPSNSESITELKKRAIQHGISYIHSRQTHIGSDKLGAHMIKMRDDLKQKGVKFVFSKTVNDIKELDYEYLIVAPGRSGSGWMEDILVSNNIKYTYRPVDIGVRVEVPKEITHDVVSVSRDMKFNIVTQKYSDMVRTFCTCPEGFVDIESHDDFVLVNGHSDADNKSNNTNFALLVTIPLTQPLVNTNIFASLIARLFKGLGADKPIFQRLGDLRKGRRSRKENQDKFAFKPTLTDVTYGDISLAMPSRYVCNLVDALDRLNNIMPGISGDSTVLYAPEIKFHGLNINTDEFQGVGNNIYVAGDGAGITRGIVGAAASGILAAEGISRD